MDSRCIPRIYGPRPRREEVCGSILAEPKARLISNRKLPTGEVEVRIFAGIYRISMVHIIYTMIYGLLSPPKLVHYRAIYIYMRFIVRAKTTQPNSHIADTGTGSLRYCDSTV